MSTKPPKFWPQEGFVWHYWSDLLVATQLAAARAGFTAIQREWKAVAPDVLTIRCSVKHNHSRTGHCNSRLLTAAPVNMLEPNGSWNNPPTDVFGISPGSTIDGFRDLHIIEGAVRAAARQEGCFVSAGVESTTTEETIYAITCVLGPARCPFLLRFRQLEGQGGEPSDSFLCLEVRGQHTCSSYIKSARATQMALVLTSLTAASEDYAALHADRPAHRILPGLVEQASSSSANADLTSTAAAGPPPVASSSSSSNPYSRLSKAETALASASTAFSTAETTLVEKRRKKVERAQQKEKEKAKKASKASSSPSVGTSKTKKHKSKKSSSKRSGEA
ncbi:hypothetical protein JCM8547_005974 [Rhodosporidiobolus lusitaniae]